MLYSKRVIQMMEYVMFALIGISFFLLLVSFFGKDRLKQVEEQLDQLTLSLAQETYQLKKRLKVLEEELLMDDVIQSTKTRAETAAFSVHDRIRLLYKQGLSAEQIARETAMTVEEVRMVLRGIAR